MAKRISANELFDKEDIFEGIRKSAEQTIRTLEKIDGEFKKIGATLKKDISQAKFGGAKELKEFMQMVEKANNLQRDTIRLEKEKAIAEQQSEKLNQQRIRTQEAENRQQQRINKQRERARRIARDEADAYKRLVKQTRELKNESKRLGAEMLILEQSGKKNTAEYRKLSATYKQVSRSAQQGDAQLKKLDKTVGDNFRNVGNYVGALNTLKTGLAQLGFAFGIGTVVRGGIDAIVDFDQAIADLSAITGATGKDLEFYKKQANELGISVEGGASAVVEAYKLIGSAKPELLENAEALNEVTKSAILLSQASGMQLPEASKNLTDAMNQFGASSEQAGKFVDVLASGSKFGAVEIPQITEALLKFGAVSRTSNVSIQESVALIEVLGKSGVKGAEAGTKLRNVMLKLSAPDVLPKRAIDSMERLGINFDLISDTSKPFSERLEAMKPILSDVGAMTEVFGVQNEVVGQIILENTELFDEYTEKMDTNGVAQEQADRRTNTLGHSLMELKNTFFSLFTTVGDGEGSMQWLINGIQWLNQNLPMIASVIFKVVRAWVVYKGVILALRGVHFVLNGGFQEIIANMMKQIPLTKAYRIEQQRLATSVNGASRSMSRMSRVMSAMPLIAIIGLVMELADAFWNTADASSEATRQQDRLNDAIQEGKNIGQKASQQINNALAKKGEEINLKFRELKIGKSKAKQDQLELERLEELRKATQGANAEIQKKVDHEQKSIDHHRKRIKHEKETLKALKKRTQTQGVLNAIESTEGVRDENIAKEQKHIEIQKALQEQIETNDNVMKDYVLSGKELVAVRHHHSKVNRTSSQTESEYKTQFKETNEHVSKQIELMQELTEIEQERELIRQQKGIDREFKEQLKLLKETGEFDATRLNEMIQEKIALEKGYIDQRLQFEMDAIDRKIEHEEKAEADALFKEREKLIAGAKGNAEAIQKINDNFDVKDAELVEEQLKRRKDAETEKVILTEKAVNDKLEIEEDGMESLKEMNDEFDSAEQDRENDKLERQKQNWQTSQQLVKASADFFVQQSQRKIEQIEKEISMAEKQADTLRTLAENGNIEAKESLAEQQKIIAEANRKKEAEQKRQQRIRLAESVYSTYTQKVSSGSKNALAETIRDTTLLQQFIQSLPTFESGIEDTGTNGRGIDGKGGFLSVLHPNERVVPKSLNEQIGGMTNDELSQLAMEYQNGKIVRSDSQTTSALELAVLVNRLDNLTKVIQDKPETNIELGEITQGAMEIVKSTKKGNTVVYNRYKVK